MAVQAQYPSNVLLLNNIRNEQERKDMNYSQQPSTQFLDQNAIYFANNMWHPHLLKKKGKEIATPTQMLPPPQQSNQINLLSFNPQPVITTPAFINLQQLQNNNNTQLQNNSPSLVSTGLQLTFNDQNQTSLSSFLSEDLALQVRQQENEIEQYLLLQGEQLKRTLAERQKQHYRALLATVEQSAGNKIREKELQLQQSAQRSAELEEQLTRLNTETMAWQAKAMAEQQKAASLHAQLQQAAAAAAQPASSHQDCSEFPADDAESAHIDPTRVDPGMCQVCRTSRVSVVLLPCRHLCLCSGCDAECCPLCSSAKSGRVQVFFS